MQSFCPPNKLMRSVANLHYIVFYRIVWSVIPTEIAFFSRGKPRLNEVFLLKVYYRIIFPIYFSCTFFITMKALDCFIVPHWLYFIYCTLLLVSQEGTIRHAKATKNFFEVLKFLVSILCYFAHVVYINFINDYKENSKKKGEKL